MSTTSNPDAFFCVFPAKDYSPLCLLFYVKLFLAFSISVKYSNVSCNGYRSWNMIGLPNGQVLFQILLQLLKAMKLFARIAWSYLRWDASSVHLLIFLPHVHFLSFSYRQSYKVKLFLAHWIIYLGFMLCYFHCCSF